MAGRYSCAVLLAYAGLGLSGCVIDSTAAPREDTASEAQQLAEKATQRVCDILETCCVDANFTYSEQGCKAFHKQRISQYFTVQTFLGAKLDTEAAQRCLDSIGQVSDGCPVDRAGGYLTDACAWVFKGSVPLGGECDSNHGCATTPDAPLTCDRKYDARAERFIEPGVCIANPPLVSAHPGLGQACSATCTGDDGGPCFGTGNEDTCFTSEGLFCSWESNQCVAQSESGGPCNGSDECTSGNYCDFDDFKCAPIRPLGAACSAWIQCGPNYCTDGTCQRPPRATAEFCVGQIPPPPMN